MHWIRSKDPDLLIVKRSVRAAVVIPSVFAIAHTAFSDAQVGLFAAFGSFALLLLVEFTGRPRSRIICYGGLFAVGGCFTVVGTVASTNKVAAVVAMALVGFAVLFAGVVAPQAATASTAALLTFVLPVAVAQPTAEVGPRLVGWALAGSLLHPSLHARVASPLARQPPTPAGRRGLGARPSGRRAAPAVRRIRGVCGGMPPSWDTCASNSPARPTPRRARRRAPLRCPSWWVGWNGLPATPR